MKSLQNNQHNSIVMAMVHTHSSAPASGLGEACESEDVANHNNITNDHVSSVRVEEFVWVHEE